MKRKLSFFGVNPGVLFGFVFLVALLFATTPSFRQVSTLQSLFQQASLNAIIAVGMTFVIITAGIDLSVGSILGLVGVVTAMTLMGPQVVSQFGERAMFLACIAGIAAGALVGFLNGAAVAWLRMQPFIVTLATMWIVRGAALVITDGAPIGVVDPSQPMAAMRNDLLQHKFTVFGMGYMGPLPISALIAFIVVILGHILLTRTIFGRHVFALGGNAEAARLSGVNVNKVRVSVFTISGLLAGLAGVLLTSKLVGGQPTVGQGFELYAIAAVVVGGTSLFGGSGSVVGSAIGALIIQVINMGLDLHGLSDFWQRIVTGAIIFLAVLLDEVLRRRKG
ncbi:MAG: ribose transport system permease protein [Fimbriimonadaceae bacterium]|nr:ribose transport system permease protein [Fimbriimonadaceae bacterium]